jgi:hypothetical protein
MQTRHPNVFIIQKILYGLRKRSVKLYLSEKRKKEVQTIDHIFEDFKVCEPTFELFKIQRTGI